MITSAFGLLDVDHAPNASWCCQHPEQKFKQTGLTLEVTSPVISAMQTIDKMSDAASDTKDSRMQGLALANAGFAGKNTYDAIKAGQGTTINGKEGQIPTKVDADGKVLESRDANAADKAGGINIAISIVSSSSQSNSLSQSDTARGSAVTAGGTITIAATGAGADSNLTIQGSNVEAGRAVQLLADNQVKLLAAQNTASEKSTNSNSSGSIGISYGTDGLLLNLSASAGKGRGDGADTFYTNTQVKAGDQVSITSGGDTTLQGAVVKANQVKADVGGNLNIASLQDTSTYTSEQKSMGGSMSVGWGKMSGSVNASKSNIDSNFNSVGQQSGIKAGSGGFQVSVGGNTALLGSVIASDTQAVNAQKNSFKTGGTLTIADIQNVASYSAKSIGISMGSSQQPTGKMDLSGLGLGLGSDSGDASSTSSAGISGIAGNTAVRSTDAETGLQKIFDADKVQREINAQMQITQAFTREAPKAVANFAASKYNELKDIGPAEAAKWAEGGIYRIALHTVVGALGGGFDGAVGAAVSASSANLMNALQNGIQQGLVDAGLSDSAAKALAQSVATLTAAGIGVAVGGAQGAATGATIDANNRQLHPVEVKFLADKDRVKRYVEYMKDRGVSLTEEQASQALDQYGAAMADENWAKLNGRDPATERFILTEASKSSSFYVDSQGKSQQIFAVTAIEYKNELINLKPLFSAYESDPTVQKYLNDNFDKTRLTNWMSDYKAGQQLGHAEAGNNASLLGDTRTILAALAGAPKYVKDALVSDEIGPFDDQQMKSYYQTLLNLQGRGLEAGYVSELDWATTQRLTLLGIPMAELGGVALGALARLPGNLAKASMVRELIANGVKVTPDDILAIARLPDGKIVFLEKGQAGVPGIKDAGMAHIIKEHGAEFAGAGIGAQEIPKVLINALNSGKIVGYLGQGVGRPIIETVVNGQTIKVGITVGNNGYIVGANYLGRAN
jgi:hypothetical protein